MYQCCKFEVRQAYIRLLLWGRRVCSLEAKSDWGFHRIVSIQGVLFVILSFLTFSWLCFILYKINLRRKLLRYFFSWGVKWLCISVNLEHHAGTYVRAAGTVSWFVFVAARSGLLRTRDACLHIRPGLSRDKTNLRGAKGNLLRSPTRAIHSGRTEWTRCNFPFALPTVSLLPRSMRLQTNFRKISFPFVNLGEAQHGTKHWLIRPVVFSTAPQNNALP